MKLLILSIALLSLFSPIHTRQAPPLDDLTPEIFVPKKNLLGQYAKWEIDHTTTTVGVECYPDLQILQPVEFKFSNFQGKHCAKLGLEKHAPISFKLDPLIVFREATKKNIVMTYENNKKIKVEFHSISEGTRHATLGYSQANMQFAIDYVGCEKVLGFTKSSSCTVIYSISTDVPLERD